MSNLACSRLQVSNEQRSWKLMQKTLPRSITRGRVIFAWFVFWWPPWLADSLALSLTIILKLLLTAAYLGTSLSETSQPFLLFSYATLHFQTDCWKALYIERKPLSSLKKTCTDSPRDCVNGCHNVDFSILNFDFEPVLPSSFGGAGTQTNWCLNIPWLAAITNMWPVHFDFL